MFFQLCKLCYKQDTVIWLVDQLLVMWLCESESHLVYIVQQHHVCDPEVFGCDCAVLQSMGVQKGHVFSVPQPHSSSFTHDQIMTRTLQVQHLGWPEDITRQQHLTETNIRVGQSDRKTLGKLYLLFFFADLQPQNCTRITPLSMRRVSGAHSSALKPIKQKGLMNDAILLAKLQGEKKPRADCVWWERDTEYL